MLSHLFSNSFIIFFSTFISTLVLTFIIFIYFFNKSKFKLISYYSQILDYAPIGILLTNDNGEIQTINLKATRDLNASPDFLKGKPMKDFILPDDEFKLLLHLHEIKEKTGEHAHCEVFFLGLNGLSFERNIHSIRIFPDSNLHLLFDNSEQKMASKRQEEIQNQMMISGKLSAIGELAAGMAHEINNPLAIIKGYVEILEDLHKKNENPSPLALDFFQTIHRSIDRIKNIIMGLSNFSKSESDDIQIIDLNKIIDDSMNFLGKLYAKNGINLIKEIKTKEALFFIGNTNKFQQVMLNILNNAKDSFLTQNTLHKIVPDPHLN